MDFLLRSHALSFIRAHSIFPVRLDAACETTTQRAGRDVGHRSSNPADDARTHRTTKAPLSNIKHRIFQTAQPSARPLQTPHWDGKGGMREKKIDAIAGATKRLTPDARRPSTGSARSRTPSPGACRARRGAARGSSGRARTGCRRSRRAGRRRPLWSRRRSGSRGCA